MTYAIFVPLGLVLAVQAAPAEESPPDETAAWRKAFDGYARQHRITATDDPAQPFRLVDKPVFYWNQPVRFNQIGSLYLWLQPDGRPGAIGTLYCWKAWQEFWAVTHEFHSLADRPLTMTWRGQVVWTPNRPGLQWSPLPGSPAPGRSTALQRQQIRLLARGFQAETIDKTGRRWQLRLLAKPLYDYTVSKDPPARTGAVFVMCQGVDPELLLVVEARPTEEGNGWHYACGAFTDYELHVRYRGKEVWSAEATPTGGDPTSPYWRDRITSRGQLPADEESAEP